jgi:hypothetical protein
MPGTIRHRLQLLVTLAIATVLTLAILLVGSRAADAAGYTAECDPIVTFTTSGVDGDDRAVSITSQVLVAGVDGWEHLSWQAAPGTTLDSVVVVGTDTTTVLRDGDLSNGLAEDAVEITFCRSTAAVGSEATVAAVKTAAVHDTPTGDIGQRGDDTGGLGDTGDAATTPGGDPAPATLTSVPAGPGDVGVLDAEARTPLAVNIAAGTEATPDASPRDRRSLTTVAVLLVATLLALATRETSKRSRSRDHHAVHPTREARR